MAQACAFCGTFDQTRDVCHHDGCILVDLCHAEVGFKRGEWIIADFRLCIGERRKQSGFSRIRQTDDSNIGNKFEFETDHFFFVRFTAFRCARCLIA